jgi:hypothetical protein
LLVNHYLCLTGKEEATYSGGMSDYGKKAGGPLLDFMGAVFHALNLKASAEMLARREIAIRKKRLKSIRRDTNA